MGAHSTRSTTHADLGRVAGRGVLTASAALALTGAGAGAALAHDTTGPSDVSSSYEPSTPSELCDVFGDLDSDPDLSGLGDLSGGMCSTDDSGSDKTSHDSFWDDPSQDSGRHHADQGSSGADTTASNASSSGSSDQGGSAAPAAPASSPAPAAPAKTVKPVAATSPEDTPPAPGQTKTLDIPAKPGA